MRAEVFWIDGLPGGRLGIAARPRGGDWLDDEVRAWRDAGVDSVVSLLTPEEEIELDLREEEDECRRHGVRFQSFAIPDRGVPASTAAFRRLVSALLEDLKAGRTVVVHCRQGIGRSALVAASAMTSSGEDAARAFERIERARGCPVPDTDEQRTWVRSFAEAESLGARPGRRARRPAAVPKRQV